MSKEGKKTPSEHRTRGLKPAWKEGQSGNPNGRPVGSRNVSTILREMLAEIAPDEIVSTKFVKEFCKGRKKVTTADAIAARLLNEGLVKGESWAMRELIDRTEGKAPQTIEITDDAGQKWRQAVTQLIESKAAKDETEAAQLLESVGFTPPVRELGNVG